MHVCSRTCIHMNVSVLISITSNFLPLTSNFLLPCMLCMYERACMRACGHVCLNVLSSVRQSLCSSVPPSIRPSVSVRSSDRPCVSHFLVFPSVCLHVCLSISVTMNALLYVCIQLEQYSPG